jgi:hypothetical protein
MSNLGNTSFTGVTNSALQLSNLNVTNLNALSVNGLQVKLAGIPPVNGSTPGEPGQIVVTATKIWVCTGPTAWVGVALA